MSVNERSQRTSAIAAAAAVLALWLCWYGASSFASLCPEQVVLLGDDMHSSEDRITKRPHVSAPAIVAPPQFGPVALSAFAEAASAWRFSVERCLAPVGVADAHVRLHRSGKGTDVRKLRPDGSVDCGDDAFRAEDFDSLEEYEVFVGDVVRDIQRQTPVFLLEVHDDKREIPRGDFKHWKERGVRRITVQLAVWYWYDVSGMTCMFESAQSKLRMRRAAASYWTNTDRTFGRGQRPYAVYAVDMDLVDPQGIPLLALPANDKIQCRVQLKPTAWIGRWKPGMPDGTDLVSPEVEHVSPPTGPDLPAVFGRGEDFGYSHKEQVALVDRVQEELLSGIAEANERKYELTDTEKRVRADRLHALALSKRHAAFLDRRSSIPETELLPLYEYDVEEDKYRERRDNIHLETFAFDGKQSFPVAFDFASECIQEAEDEFIGGVAVQVAPFYGDTRVLLFFISHLIATVKPSAVFVYLTPSSYRSVKKAIDRMDTKNVQVHAMRWPFLDPSHPNYDLLGSNAQVAATQHFQRLWSHRFDALTTIDVDEMILLPQRRTLSDLVSHVRSGTKWPLFIGAPAETQFAAPNASLVALTSVLYSTASVDETLKCRGTLQKASLDESSKAAAVFKRRTFSIVHGESAMQEQEAETMDMQSHMTPGHLVESWCRIAPSIATFSGTVRSSTGFEICEIDGGVLGACRDETSKNAVFEIKAANIDGVAKWASAPVRVTVNGRCLRRRRSEDVELAECGEEGTLLMLRVLADLTVQDSPHLDAHAIVALALPQSDSLKWLAMDDRTGRVMLHDAWQVHNWELFTLHGAVALEPGERNVLKQWHWPAWSRACAAYHARVRALNVCAHDNMPKSLSVRVPDEPNLAIDSHAIHTLLAGDAMKESQQSRALRLLAPAFPWHSNGNVIPQHVPHSLEWEAPLAAAQLAHLRKISPRLHIRNKGEQLRSVVQLLVCRCPMLGTTLLLMYPKEVSLFSFIFFRRRDEKPELSLVSERRTNVWEWFKTGNKPFPNHPKPV